MVCCSECFSSSYLKGIINSGVQKIGTCGYCASQKVPTYEAKELGQLFPNILDLYVSHPTKGQALAAQIESDFQGKLFSDKVGKNKKKLLREIVSQDFETYKHLFRGKVIQKKLTKKNLSKPLQISWEKFANEIKSTNRFHIENALDLSKLKSLLEWYEKPLPKAKQYFRARISNKKGYSKSELFNPPPEKARAGRANPQGISYLYLANDTMTTFYETRVSLFDYATVGEFRLKEDITVINLRGDTYDPVELAEGDLLTEFLIHLPFMSKLERELSKPRRRSDSELDYLPTQYLCEFIKSLGYDGVEFQSSLNPKGYNLTIFNPAKLECVKVDTYEIENLDLKQRLVD